MIQHWELVSGIFTFIFLLGAFYFVIVAGLKDYGKRGWLFIAAISFLGPGFLLDLVSEVYENETAELLSHGAILMAGILFLLSIYLSKKELETEVKARQ
jgi:predicted transporter